MKANLSVYTLADSLNMSDIKTKAVKKFLSVARYWEPFPLEELPDMIKAICEATSEIDKSIGGPVLTKCAKYYQRITPHKGCVCALSEHGEFNIALTCAVGENLEDQLNEADEARTSLAKRVYDLENNDREREAEVKLMN